MNKRFTLSIIFLTIALDFFNLGLIFPIFSSMVFEGNGQLVSVDASEFHKNALFGILISVFAVGQFLGAPVLGKLSDTYGRRKLLVLTLFGAVATLLLCAVGIIMESIALLLIGRFVGGLMAGNMTLAYASLADLSAPEEKVRNFSLVPLATGVGFAGGPYVAGMMADWYADLFGGPALPFFLAAILSLVNLALAAWKFPESSAKVEHRLPILDGFTAGLRNITQFIRPNRMRPYFWILFLMISANLVFCQFVGPFAIEKFKINIRELGYLYANIGVSVALGHLFLTRKLGAYLSLESTLAGSLLCLSLLLVAVFIVPSLLLLHLITFLVMLACAVAYTNAMALVSNQATSDIQGETMGIAVSIQSCAEFLPAALLGLVASLLVGLPILVASVLSLLAFVILTNDRKELVKVKIPIE